MWANSLAAVMVLYATLSRHSPTAIHARLPITGPMTLIPNHHKWDCVGGIRTLGDGNVIYP